MSAAPTPLQSWPPRTDLLGVQFSRTTYEQAEETIICAARLHEPAVVTHVAVHGLMTAVRDPEYRRAVNSCDITGADGQPVRWALNHLHSAALPDRLYGPELMMRLCRRAAQENVSIYLYGSSPAVLQRLQTALASRCPGLRIAGAESPPFRALSAQEEADAVERINASGAGLVFIGLGCPRQDFFASRTRNRIRAVQVCVGAAFDFYAGNKRMAPRWMQRVGLEWLFRLSQEPGRLWRRYLVTNTLFVLFVARRLVMGR